MENVGNKPKHEPKFTYFVDNVKFETDQSTLTGAQIKARIPNLDPSYGLFLEMPGEEPDKQILDDTSVELKKEHGPLRFYTVPPANFGNR
jgi:hypothetical protein